MQKYQNLSGASNVDSFEMSDNAILVMFKDGSVYLYNTGSPGQYAVDEMKRLAIAGRGLNSYISRVVKKRYASKLR